MPPLPRLRVTVLADLAEQLKFTPREVARKQLESAEGLLSTIEPDGTYPEDWLVSRITGYRPDVTEPSLLVGEALRRDLGALVERLSIRAEYETRELAGWLTVDDLCARWRVTRRTLERYRDLGLQGRRARQPRAPEGNGKQVLLYSPAVVAWFERAHATRLDGAAGFTRIDGPLAARLIRWAARYRQRFGWSRGEVAKRLSARFSRSPDAIRRLLIRHDDLHAAEAPPIFSEPGPATDRQARLIERASRWRGYGVHPRLIAKRLRKSAATIHRVMCEQRAEMLRNLRLDKHEQEAADDAGSGEQAGADAASAGKSVREKRGTRAPARAKAGIAPVARAVLSPDSVRMGLGLPGTTTVPEFIAHAERAGWPEAKAERERALALMFLRARAVRAIASLPQQSPSALHIDAIVTDLRWMARLKTELIRGQGMLLLKTIETRVGRDLSDLPPAPAARVLATSLEALSGGRAGEKGGPIDQFDPDRGGRLAAPAGIALNKAIARWLSQEGAELARAAPLAPRRDGQAPLAPADAPTRATRIMPTAPLTLRDWTHHIAPWQAWTEPHPALREALDRADESTRALLAKRYGLLISPPMSLVELAEEMEIRPEQVRQRERTAVRELLAAGAEPNAGPSRSARGKRRRGTGEGTSRPRGQ